MGTQREIYTLLSMLDGALLATRSSRESFQSSGDNYHARKTQRQHKLPLLARAVFGASRLLFVARRALSLRQSAMPEGKRKTRLTKKFAPTALATPKSCKCNSTRHRFLMNNCSQVFWSNHNPTQVNRQGPDVGSQYRSVIFYHSDEQKAAAEKSKADLEASGQFSSSDCHANRSRTGFLRSRRLSSAISRKTRPRQLPHLIFIHEGTRRDTKE